MSYKYWLKNVSFVIICLFILFQILLSFKPYLGTNKTEEYVYYKRDWIRSNIGEKVKNKENIVVLGDSTITSGFLPNIFDNDWQIDIKKSIADHAEWEAKRQGLLAAIKETQKKNALSELPKKQTIEMKGKDE